MIKLIKGFANLNIILGALLLISPLIYLLVITPLQPTVIASNMTPQEETQILTQKLTPDNKALNPNKQNTLATVNIAKTVKTDHQYVKIPSIGLDTEIYQGQTDKTLDKGVWLMPDLGYPEDLSKPTVLAAHRWGPDTATNEYRSKNLFLNVPKIQTGDIIEIIWNDVSYKYKVTFKEENVYVSKSSDLILLTCKYYHSNIRIIVYAERI